jgi:cell division protein FtsA
MELKKSGWGGQTPAGLVITGGGAKTVGIQDAAKRTLAMPVRIGYPNDLKGIIDEAQDSSFATVIGLVIHGGKMESSSSGKFGLSLPKVKGLKLGKIGKKFFELIKSFIP